CWRSSERRKSDEALRSKGKGDTDALFSSALRLFCPRLMMHISYMLFDLDGTLIDSKTDLTNSINLMLADVGRPPLDEATVGGFVGDGVRVLVRRCLTATDPDHQP